MPPTLNLQRLIFASAAFAIMVMATSKVWGGLITTTTEPASLFLLGSGLAGTASVLRRRFKNGATK